MNGRDDALGEPLADFLGRLASSSPAPGGGSAAAVAVAMGAGLVQSVASQSAGHWVEAGGAAAQAKAIRGRVAPLIELDAVRYGEALQLLANRESIDAALRDSTIGEALEAAAMPLLQIAEAAADVGELAAEASTQGEPAVRADALSSAMLAEAAAGVALALLEINLGTVAQDPRLEAARELHARTSRSRERALSAVTG